MSTWCQPHWDMLRQEIEDIGLSGFVAGNAEIAMMNTVGELQGDEKDAHNYDPLMASYWMIENRILDGFGLPSMMADFGCGICRVNDSRTSDGRCKCPDPDCRAKEAGSIPSADTWLHGEDSAPRAAKAFMIEQGWLAA